MRRKVHSTAQYCGPSPRPGTGSPCVRPSRCCWETRFEADPLGLETWMSIQTRRPRRRRCLPTRFESPWLAGVVRSNSANSSPNDSAIRKVFDGGSRAGRILVRHSGSADSVTTAMPCTTRQSPQAGRPAGCDDVLLSAREAGCRAHFPFRVCRAESQRGHRTPSMKLRCLAIVSGQFKLNCLLISSVQLYLSGRQKWESASFLTELDRTRKFSIAFALAGSGFSQRGGHREFPDELLPPASSWFAELTDPDQRRGIDVLRSGPVRPSSDRRSKASTQPR